MNTYYPIALLARKSLLLLAGVLVVCVAVVYGLLRLEGHWQEQLVQEQAVLLEQQAQLQVKQADVADVQAYLQRYHVLTAQGLMGTPDRTLWVEQLQNSARQVGLPGAVQVVLERAQTLHADPNAPPPEGAVGPVTEPQQHDLRVEIQAVHEADLLALLADYRTHVAGRFRVNMCKLSEPKDTGLTAQCVLRFVSLP